MRWYCEMCDCWFKKSGDCPDCGYQLRRQLPDSESPTLAHITEVLSTFYRSELSLSSVQPVLDLAVQLNPELSAQAVRRG